MKTLIIPVLLVSGLLSAAGCPPKPEPTPIEPEPVPTTTVDSGVDPLPPLPEPTGADRCERGYNRALGLGCPPAAACDSGDHCSWVAACREIEERGIDMNPDCLESAQNCETVQRCLSQGVD